MFGMGFWEIAAILVIAVLVFGPERLPALAKQAAGFVRTVRHMAENAKADLVKEFGDDFKDLDLQELKGLDPRHVVRDTILGPGTAAGVAEAASRNPGGPTLPPDGKAPFDDEAT